MNLEKNNVDTVFNKIPDTNYRELAQAIDPSEFKKLVESRRSVRVFRDDPVPEAVMQTCLDLALLAPNSSNLQPWEFYWVRSTAKRKALVDACFSQPAARTARELVVCVARTDTWRARRDEMLQFFSESSAEVPKTAIHYYEKLVPLAYDQGLFGTLGIFKKFYFWWKGLKEPTIREPTSQADMKQWAVKSTALACENLMLAVHAHGFDSCPMEGLDSKRVAKILDLDPGAVVVMALGIGKRAENGVYGPRVRFAREHFVKEV